MKDEAEAVRYYKLVVDQNDTDAQYDYTICLANGRGVVKDEVHQRNAKRMVITGLRLTIGK